MLLTPKKLSEKKSFAKWIVPLLLALGYALTYLTGIRCIWKELLGISCPGCGFTRSVLCAIKGDFVTAFHLHPLFWTFPLMVIWFIADGNIFKSKKGNAIISIAFAAAFVAVWVYRLISGNSV